MSIWKHFAYSALAISVVAGMPYLFNELQKHSIAENEAAQRQLDQLMIVTRSPLFEVLEITKQQAIIKDANGMWVVHVGDVLPNGETIVSGQPMALDLKFQGIRVSISVTGQP
ncbi:MAG TPA: hypothetical protein GXX48_24530 [Ochrobactrum intermedium]|uniref:Uncharacterized protein n=1 Tax=Brucella intermedia TaxID=94625 RepID=A0A7V6U2A4_9HYPH|nr:hypothetical protein [Brucella intermedia]HHV70763.1 hypothetical protein [Brucella intermedia]